MHGEVGKQTNLLSSTWSTFSDGKLRARCLNREAYDGMMVGVAGGMSVASRRSCTACVVNVRDGGWGGAILPPTYDRRNAQLARASLRTVHRTRKPSAVQHRDHNCAPTAFASDVRFPSPPSLGNFPKTRVWRSLPSTLPPTIGWRLFFYLYRPQNLY